MERELKQAKADLDAKTGEIKNLQGRVENYKGDISKLEQQMKEQKVVSYQILLLTISSVKNKRPICILILYVL